MNEKYYLRSTEWFGKDDKMGFVHRNWLNNQGQPDHMFRRRAVVFENIEDYRARIDDFDFLIGGSGSEVLRDLH